MPDKLIAKLEKQGRLRKQKRGIIQVRALLNEAVCDLNEAKKIVHLAQRATYILAYMAMLKGGRALLLLHGYVPDDGAQHKTVVEVTSTLLGEEYTNLVTQFESMRRKRNEMTYEAGFLLSQSEVEKALEDAIVLIKKIVAEAKLHSPQLEFEFDLE